MFATLRHALPVKTRQFWNTMISLLALCLSFLHLTVALETSKTLGVHPNLIAKYVPLKSGNWNCLDGLKQIPWDFVNDDSCDCLDGSDEPGPMFQLNHERWVENDLFQGTGACPNTNFYCRNEGHIGVTIPSSHVNDGLCGAHYYYPSSSTAFLISLCRKGLLWWVRRTSRLLSKCLQGDWRYLSRTAQEGAKDTKDGHYIRYIYRF